MEITKSEFDAKFKKLIRFLKEIGKYKFMMDYLFPVGSGRGKEQLFLDIQKCSYFNFSNIFNYELLLGPSYKKRGGNGYWALYIQEIHQKWQIYYDKIKIS